MSLPETDLERLEGRLRRCESRLAQLEDWKGMKERPPKKPFRWPQIDPQQALVIAIFGSLIISVIQLIRGKEPDA